MGFLVTLGPVLGAFYIGLLGLALLWTVWTAILWVAIVATIIFCGLWYNRRHNGGYEYDDKLSTERMRLAREDLVRRWKNEKNVET